MKLKRCAFLFVIGIAMLLSCACGAVDLIVGNGAGTFAASSVILFGVLGVLYLVSYALISSRHPSRKGFFHSLAGPVRSVDGGGLGSIYLEGKAGRYGVRHLYGGAYPAARQAIAGCKEHPGRVSVMEISAAGIGGRGYTAPRKPTRESARPSVNPRLCHASPLKV